MYRLKYSISPEYFLMYPPVAFPLIFIDSEAQKVRAHLKHLALNASEQNKENKTPALNSTSLTEIH